MSAVDEATEYLQTAVAARARAREYYMAAIFKCVAAGMSNTKIAKIAGVSETAIRAYRKRHGL